MSAPVAERQRVAAQRGRGATVPSQRGARTARGGAVAVPAQRGAGRATAAQRAYARRDDRVRRSVGGRPVRTTAPAGRAQFILLVMVLLGAGLVATLWLSTAAAADSYRLQDARTQARTLTEQSERLRREVASMDAPPALAQRASDLGLVPVKDPARLVVGPDGAVSVVGTPQVAAAPAPPVPPAPVPATPPADGAAPPADAAAPPAGAATPPVTAESATQADPAAAGTAPTGTTPTGTAPTGTTPTAPTAPANGATPATGGQPAGGTG